MKIIIMAWRNIWRTPWRSLVVIGAMSLGVWSGIFMMGWINGLNDQRTISMLDDNVGHGRICSKDFLEKPEIFSTIKNLEALSNRLVADSNVTTFSSRVICNSMIQAGSGSAPIIAYGVNPNNEKKVFKSVQNISSGEFLKGQVGDEVVLGEALARKLEVDIDDRVVLTFQDINGDVRSALFWLVGIYDGASSMIEESIIYVPSKTISFQMGLIDSIELSNESQIIAHEINYRVKNPYEIEKANNALESSFLKNGNSESQSIVFRTWKEVSPDLGVADAILSQSLLLFMMIILLAMSFGILNTMLMAILERTRELGMLMAIGMNKKKIFKLIVSETILLSFVGLPFGLFLGHISLLVTSKTGITLKSVEQGFEQMGLEATVYPSVVPEYYLPIVGLVLILSFLSSIYPAIKALKLNPIESMRVL